LQVRDHSQGLTGISGGEGMRERSSRRPPEVSIRCHTRRRRPADAPVAPTGSSRPTRIAVSSPRRDPKRRLSDGRSSSSKLG
jgi:hypothetical protein